jgi:alkylation response protein AidB-like acyl-CoA dehydrogenase
MELASRLYTPDLLEMAAWYRSCSLDVVSDPDRILAFSEHPLVLKRIEAEFDATTCRRAEMFEAMAYGDASFLLTTPGPSLSGVLLQVLGDTRQWDYFYHYVIDHRSRTFFAVTEPHKGSDAANLETTLSASHRLNGQKLLFGNGAVASIGTVLVRTGNGPLDMAAVLLTPALLGSAAVTRQSLDMFAMHGARLAYLRFDNLEVPPESILGRHLKPTESGMMGLLKTFHRFRPSVSAMAIGHGQAIVDYVRARILGHGSELREHLDAFDRALERVRSLNLSAARLVDQDPLQGSLVSLAKARATETVEQVARFLSRRLPAAALVEHPWLARSLADVYAFEYMEGITPIQLVNVFNGFRRREVAV